MPGVEISTADVYWTGGLVWCSVPPLHLRLQLAQAGGGDDLPGQRRILRPLGRGVGPGRIGLVRGQQRQLGACQVAALLAHAGGAAVHAPRVRHLAQRRRRRAVPLHAQLVKPPQVRQCRLRRQIDR
eukprot:1182512-Prorocentrum_minimum.AAC.6